MKISLIIGVVLVAIAFFGLAFALTGGLFVPYNSDHSRIAGMIEVTDLTDAVNLEVHHVLTTEAVYHINAPQSSFVPRNTYTESLWYWSAGDSRDIDVTMTIWGPAEDGTFDIEFGRHAGNSIAIEGFNQTETWVSLSNEGYFSITGVLLPQML